MKTNTESGADTRWNCCGWSLVPWFWTLYCAALRAKGWCYVLCIHFSNTDPCAALAVQLLWAAAKVTEFRRCAKIKGASLLIALFCFVFLLSMCSLCESKEREQHVFTCPEARESLALIFCAYDWKIWNWELSFQSSLGYINNFVYSWFAVLYGKLMLWNV